MDSKRIAAELMAAIENYVAARIAYEFTIRTDQRWTALDRKWKGRSEEDLRKLIEKLLEGRHELPR